MPIVTIDKSKKHSKKSSSSSDSSAKKSTKKHSRKLSSTKKHSKKSSSSSDSSAKKSSSIKKSTKKPPSSRDSTAKKHSKKSSLSSDSSAKESKEKKESYHIQEIIPLPEKIMQRANIALTTNIKDVYSKLLNLSDLDLTSEEINLYFNSAVWKVTDLQILYYTGIDFTIPKHIYTKLTGLTLTYKNIGMYFSSQEKSNFTNIAKCTQLLHLTIQGLDMEDVDINAINKCTQLTTLNLIENHNLKQVDFMSSLSNLTSLYLKTKDIGSTSFLKACPRLQVLHLQGDYTNINGIKHCPSLTELHLLEQSHLKDIQAIIQCPLLQTLDISKCEKLKDISPISECKSLLSVGFDVSTATKIEELKLNVSTLILHNVATLNWLPKWKTVLYLHITDSDRLADIKGIHHLSQLQTLIINGARPFESFHSIKDLSGLKKCKHLESIDIHMMGLLSLNGIEGLAKLERIVVNSYNLESITALRQCPNVSVLRLNMGKVPNLQDITYCKQLLVLQIEGFLLSVSGLEKCISLQEVRLNGCHFIHDLRGIEKLPVLDRLYLNNSEGLDISAVNGCSVLTHLKVDGTTRHLTAMLPFTLQYLTFQSPEDSIGIEPLTSLKILNIITSFKEQSFHLNTPNTSIQELRLTECNLVNLKIIKLLPSLHKVFIHSCDKLISLNGIEMCLDIQVLSIYWCKNLIDISAIFQLKKLNWCMIRGGKSLRSIALKEIAKNKQWKLVNDEKKGCILYYAASLL